MGRSGKIAAVCLCFFSWGVPCCNRLCAQVAVLADPLPVVDATFSFDSDAPAAPSPVHSQPSPPLELEVPPLLEPASALLEPVPTSPDRGQTLQDSANSGSMALPKFANLGLPSIPALELPVAAPAKPLIDVALPPLDAFLPESNDQNSTEHFSPLPRIQELPSAELLGPDHPPTVQPEMQRQPTSERPVIEKPALVQLKQPWWSSTVPTDAEPQQGIRYELDELIWLAIENSPYVKSLLVQPQIQNARASAVLGEFDANTFLDTIFNDTSDPVGNTLTTGTANRLNDHTWDSSSGVRKKNVRGGQAEVSQQFMFKDSNSDFFVPSNQADTKMLMRYTQPLMRGRGEAYNRSSYVVANLGADLSLQEVSVEIQRHAFSIIEAYWQLYSARAFEQQILRGLERLQVLQQQLRGRADIDSLRSQLLRADAAVARQQASLSRARARIVTSEAQLRAAVAAPELLHNRETRILPASQTTDWPSALDLASQLTTALNYHPRVQALRTSLKATRVRMQVAEHELKPTLNLVLEGYLRGLNGDFDAAKSFGDQFSEGAPSYSAGLSYARPYRNTAAKAILRERRLELRQLLLELDHELLTLNSNVESAIAEATAAFTQLESAVQSTLATHAELDLLNARWKNAFLDATQTSYLLDNILQAEIQLIQAENNWALAQADHMTSIARVQLATGALLPVEVAEHPR